MNDNARVPFVVRALIVFAKTAFGLYMLTLLLTLGLALVHVIEPVDFLDRYVGRWSWVPWVWIATVGHERQSTLDLAARRAETRFFAWMLWLGLLLGFFDWGINAWLFSGIDDSLPASACRFIWWGALPAMWLALMKTTAVKEWTGRNGARA